MAKKTNTTRRQPRQASAKKSPSTQKSVQELHTSVLTKPYPPPAEVLASETEASESVTESPVEALQESESTSEASGLTILEEYEGPQSHSVPFEVHFAVTERVKQLEQELEALRQGDGEAEASDASKVAKHRRCPLCFERHGGVGQRRWQNQVSGRKVKRCYRCDECGTEWVVEVNVEEVDDVVMRSTRVSEIRTVGESAKTEVVA